MRRVGVVVLVLVALAGCKKKQAKPVEATPPEFVSAPGAVSEKLPLKCDGFGVADSAKARGVLALVAAAAEGKDAPEVSCFLGGPILAGKSPKGLLDPAKATVLVQKGDFMPFDIVKARSEPPHWATQVPEGTDCQTLSKDGAAVYFCKIVDDYRIVQIENLGPG